MGKETATIRTLRRALATIGSEEHLPAKCSSPRSTSSHVGVCGITAA